jgi:aminoglycoside 3-N-acetyltransferase
MLKPLKDAAKAVLEKARRLRGASKLKQSARYVTRAELTADLSKLGIAPIDALFIHSSLKSLGYVVGGATEVVRALQDAVGVEGTLLVPTYYQPGGTRKAPRCTERPLHLPRQPRRRPEKIIQPARFSKVL